MTFPNPPVAVKRATIPNGETESGAVDLEHYAIAGIIWPTMTGATCTFLVAATGGGTYVQLVDQAGSPISVTVTSNKATGVDEAARELAPWRFIKLKSASAEGAEREIELVCKA